MEHCYTFYKLSLPKLFIFTLFIIYGVSAFAQSGAIKGSILTNDHQPAAFVNVLVKELPKKGALTEENGTFFLKNLPEGTYTILISGVGIQPMEKTGTVTANQVTELNFMLSESVSQLNEVQIIETKTINERPVSIGKIAIKPLDLPQSVTTIEKVVLEQQQTLRLSEALQNANGVYQMGNTGGTQEEIASRGFAFSSSNTFKNGVRFNNAVMPEISGLERVEILKGSNAILFGNVAAGGILNLVTKKPKFENGGEVSFRAGSYDFYKPTLDIYGAINNSKHVAYRINTSYENAGSFRDKVSSERFYVNPSLLIKAGRKTDILLEGDYLHDNRTPDYGIGAVNYTISDVPRNRFLGAAWSNYEAVQKNLTATVTHQLTENWNIRAVASVQDFEKDEYSTSRPNAANGTSKAEDRFIKADGTWIRGLQRTTINENYYLGQFDVTGQFSTGFLKHQLLIGADADRYRTETPAYAFYANQKDPNKASALYDTVNIYNPDFYTKQRTDIPKTAKTGFTETPTNRFGVYVQDLIHITEKLKVLAGVRYSYQAASSTVYTIAKDGTVTPGKLAGTDRLPGKQYDAAFSPRAGLVYQPFKTTAVFASYSNSFSPNINAIDVNSELLPPSIIDQFEVGIKNDLFKGLLSANITAYQINNNNTLQTVLVLPDGTPNGNTNMKELAGTTRSEGLELDLMTKSVMGFSFIAGYSYNSTKYTKSNDQYLKGSRLRYNPAHTANASVFYTFSNKLKGLNAGFTTFYTGDRLAGRNTTVANQNYKLIALPDYFSFDAHVGYTLERISLRVKVTNLLDKLSYNAHDDNSINPIAPRMFAATIAYKL